MKKRHLILLSAPRSCKGQRDNGVCANCSRLKADNACSRCRTVFDCDGACQLTIEKKTVQYATFQFNGLLILGGRSERQLCSDHGTALIMAV